MWPNKKETQKAVIFALKLNHTFLQSMVLIITKFSSLCQYDDMKIQLKTIPG